MCVEETTLQKVACTLVLSYFNYFLCLRNTASISMLALFLILLELLRNGHHCHGRKLVKSLFLIFDRF